MAIVATFTLTVTVITHKKTSLALKSISLNFVWNDKTSLDSLWHVLYEFNTVMSHEDVLRCPTMSHEDVLGCLTISHIHYFI